MRPTERFALTFTSWVAWTRGDLELPAAGGVQPVRRIPPLQGLAAAGWTERKKRIWAEVSLRWAARQDRLSEDDRLDPRICPDGPAGCRGTPGFFALNLAAGLRMGRHVDLALRLQNLSNEAYKYHGSGVYEPGFSAVLELRLRR